MKNILQRKIDLLPQRPEPFVFRMEINPEASWTRSALNQVLNFSTIIQLEAIEGLSDGLLQIVQDLDQQPRALKIRLVLPSSQNNFSSYVKPLSRLKKSTMVMFLASINHAQEASLKNELLETMRAFSSAGIKTGLLVELAPTELTSGADARLLALEDLATQAVQAGALEIALRPLIPFNHHLRPILPEKTSEHGVSDISVSISAGLSSWVNELKVRGLVLWLEECFPLVSSAPDRHLDHGLNIGLNLNPNLHPNPNNFTKGPMPSCRQAFGSCFIDRNGLVKPCRLSEHLIGDLKQKQLKDILSSFIFSDRHYCFLESMPLQSVQSESASAPSAPSTPSAPSEFSFSSRLLPPSFLSAPSSSFNTPFILDSSLKPVPLFKLLDRDWGATLAYNYDSLVLSHKGARLAGSIDGSHNLRWFKKKFGAKALSFICGLFLKGYIRLEE